MRRIRALNHAVRRPAGHTGIRRDARPYAVALSASIAAPIECADASADGGAGDRVAARVMAMMATARDQGAGARADERAGPGGRFT